MTDQFDEIQRQMRTAVGTNEAALREQLGNEGYEAAEKRWNEVAEAGVESAKATAQLNMAQVSYVTMKAAFWAALSLAILAAGLGGLAALVWWFANVP
jgi:hypothetical protein